MSIFHLVVLCAYISDVAWSALLYAQLQIHYNAEMHNNNKSCSPTFMHTRALACFGFAYNVNGGFCF